MVPSSPRSQVHQLPSGKASGWGLGYLTRELGVWEERLFSPHSPNLDLLGFTNTFSPAEVGQWALGNEPWGVGTPEILLVILHPS